MRMDGGMGMKRRMNKGWPWLARIVLLMVAMGFVLLMAACGLTSEPSDADGESSATQLEENGSDKQKGTITLSYAFFAPENTFPAVQMKKWAEELKKRSQGQVEVEFFFGGALLDVHNMYDGVKNRVADIGLSATTYEPGRFPLLGISDLPSGYPNAKVSSQVVNELIQTFPPEALQEFKIITSFATEPSYIQSKVPISSLEELRGKQLRISGALNPVLEALGAAPVGMSQAEVPEALQTGVIEGNVSSREVLKDLKLAEMVPYVTDFPLTVTTFVAVMNRDVWNSLPHNIQQIIDDLNSEMAAFTGEYLDNHVQESLEWAQQEHELQLVSLSEEEKKRWEEKLRPLQEAYVQELEQKGLPASEYHQKLYELISKYSQAN